MGWGERELGSDFYFSINSPQAPTLSKKPAKLAGFGLAILFNPIISFLASDFDLGFLSATIF